MRPVAPTGQHGHRMDLLATARLTSSTRVKAAYHLVTASLYGLISDVDCDAALYREPVALPDIRLRNQSFVAQGGDRVSVVYSLW